ncbi:LOW QUALITY PROTEIN: uncharacterized protein LOC111043338 [Nilaparvata lugens]|uniref:LOW QUALITY PROTEIN: uncharacterized protein LOC111043338 n=1 Tax=Nilaparvata lugens TaxID=108931 RepID=UPI00193CE6E5|nr:LOW QUALITY PROTEIN: uncharacterized protein LOC111043338 [Nilaparvata lugens]
MICSVHFVVFACFFGSVMPQEHNWKVISKTRTIQTRQGPVEGLVTQSPYNNKLRNVEVFLGVPYAAPPVGSHRFMPPGSPPTWKTTRPADRLPPVCPQRLPVHQGRRVPERDRQMRRLMPYLRHENEDCLYLNIYAPARDNPMVSKKYPVIVFIHGESFEWNSGNPYDGSVLSSFGEVIVITLNFRLGILGFLRPGVSDHTLSNFGLLDQIAALQWIKDNIRAFGGDENKVTLMGHDTGAACVNYLMVSPVSQGVTGLFHRAILMSGTALADWALTKNPMSYTVQVGNALNCPTQETSEGMSNCLRRKRLSDLMAVKVGVPPFQTPFGPLIDGTVVPNEPAKLMTTYKHLFSRYELLYGMTEMESDHLLDGVSLVQGMLEEEKMKIIKDFIRAKYEALPNVALAKTITQYTNLRMVGSNSVAEENRNIVLNVLSDARVAAPLVQTANYHSQANRNSYFYVFRHKTRSNDFRPVKSMFLLLSSNPNIPKRVPFIDQRNRDWRHFDLTWPEYTINNQSFLSLGIPPKINQQYKAEYMRFWNDYLPDHLRNLHNLDDTDEDLSSMGGGWPVVRPVDPIPPPVPPPHREHHPIRGGGWDPFYNFTQTEYKEPSDERQKTPEISQEAKDEEIKAAASSLALSIVMFVGVCFLLVNLCAFIGLCYQGIDYGRERVFNTHYRCGNGSMTLDEDGEHYMRASDKEEDGGATAKELKKTEVKSILKSSEGIYEPVKAGSTKTGTGSVTRWAPVMNRQESSSTMTMDPHTKVREWIAHEIKRCSPRFLRRNKVLRKMNSTETYADQHSTNTHKMSSLSSKPESTTMSHHKSKAKKVSVAIDATPATRSPSVLQQIPIELTKSLDEGKSLNGLGGLKMSTSLGNLNKRPSLQRSDAMNPDDSEVSCRECFNDSETTSVDMFYPGIAIVHSHSISDPSPISESGDSKSSISRLDNIHLVPKKKCVSDGLYTPVSKDVNVTSRDDACVGTASTPHEDTLDNIKRRNFPKVLPDFPEMDDHNTKANKRRSLPPSSHLLPPPLEYSAGSITSDGKNRGVPPPPPPRVSTLGRRPVNNSPVAAMNSSHITVHLTRKEPTITEDKVQGLVAVKTPQVPLEKGGGNQAGKKSKKEGKVGGSKESISSKTDDQQMRVQQVPAQQKQSQVKRAEPKVIIKPSTTPITSSKKGLGSTTSSSSQIPRVTHSPIIPQPPAGTSSGKKNEQKSKPVVVMPSKSNPNENLGMGRKLKINPVKRTVSTETGTDMTSANTGTIKRMPKK